MSLWRLAVKALYDKGGEAIMAPDYGYRNSGLYEAKRLGLVAGGYHDNGSRAKAMWRLTDLGWRWCEGRVALAVAPKSTKKGRPGYRFVATWLDAFPHGARIGECCQFCSKCREVIS